MSALAPHQQRVVEERDQLRERVAKLALFIGGTENFDRLDEAEKSRLRAQLEAMHTYLTILNERIAAF